MSKIAMDFAEILYVICFKYYKRSNDHKIM